MPNKSLDADYIKNLLNPVKKTQVQTTKEVVIQFVTETKPDPLRLPQAGEMQDGDKGDIWVQWIKQHRKGAIALIERWG